MPHCTTYDDHSLYRGETKKKDVRITNIEAAKSLADAVRTSLGPRGMDKMVGCVKDDYQMFWYDDHHGRPDPHR